jgi:4-hydroxybenzoate polyprenyltransferase
MTALAANTAAGAGRLAVFGLAALLGQLSIGWSNDVFDARRDAAAGRTDKPLVTGSLQPRVALAASVLALVTGGIACFALSARTGEVNLAMMAAGWTYNAGLKRTLLSALTYAVGFGLIPVFAGTMWPGQPVPSPWTVAAAALLGLGGHFANVLPDLDADLRTGVDGLPQRVARAFGPFTVRVAALVLLTGASVILAVRAQAIAVAGAALLLAAVGLAGRGRVPFFSALAIAVVNVALFVSGGRDFGL